MTGVRERPNGRLQISYYWRGKRTWETCPAGTTKREAGKLRTQRLREVQTGQYQEPSRITVAALFGAYAQNMAATGRSAALQRVHSHAYGHLTKLIGHVAISDLTVEQVSTARDTMLSARKLGPKTVKDYMGCAQVAFAWAVRRGMLIRNVWPLVERPHVPRPAIQPLSIGDAKRLLAVLRGSSTPYGRMLALGLLTALRTESEWGGMRRGDIDLTRRVASLTQVALNEKGADGRHGVQLIPAGNDKHKRRQIELSDVACSIVKEQLEWADEWARALWGVDAKMPSAANLRAYREWQTAGLLFCAGVNLEPIPRSTLTKYWKQYLSTAGLPRTVRIHDLRHTCATLLLQAGEHPKIVQEMLGHSTIQQTLNTYSHLVPGLARAAGERLGAILVAETVAASNE